MRSTRAVVVSVRGRIKWAVAIVEAVGTTDRLVVGALGNMQAVAAMRWVWLASTVGSVQGLPIVLNQTMLLGNVSMQVSFLTLYLPRCLRGLYHIMFVSILALIEHALYLV